MTPEIHPLCAALPELSEPEMAELVADVKAHGQRYAILLDADGRIVDGRHRQRACEALGLKPLYKSLGTSDPEKIANNIASFNVHRRHLTPGKRAEILARLAYQPRGGAGRVENFAPDSGVKSERGTNVPSRDSKEVTKTEHITPAKIADVAKAAGISEKTIDRAKAAAKPKADLQAALVMSQPLAGPLGDAKAAFERVKAEGVQLANAGRALLAEMDANPAAACIDRTAVQSALEQIRVSISTAAPTAACECGGKADCKACKGRGWLSKTVAGFGRGKK